MIDEMELIEELIEEVEDCYGRETPLTLKARDYINNSRQNGGWIPVTYHEPVEEDGEDMRYNYILDCLLPDEGEEILISVNGIVSIDVCCYYEGWYLDSYGDWLNVDAWMPLPKPYKAGDKE